MYRACIHCYQDLGRNEVVEPFPVGRRLAFDSSKGRLWVICPHCGRWNLTPLEERWEAVEECERRFRGMRLRAQTPNIGLTRLSEGLELVRIGRPLRPEFAAWRYGREFTRRRTRQVLAATGLGVAIVGVAFAGAYAAPSLVLPIAARWLFEIMRGDLKLPTVVELPRGPGRAWTVDCSESMLLPDGTGWRLSVMHHFGRAELSGDEARRWLRQLLARVNRSGGSDRLVADAVKQIESTQAELFMRAIAEESERRWAVDRERIRRYESELNQRFFNSNEARPTNGAGLARMPAARRLALEMALHETTEQQAIAGELASLEAAWREAEEIAGIADDLLLPPGVTDFVERNRPRNRID